MKKCSTCDGTGVSDVCSECGGTGFDEDGEEECLECDGTGEETCTECDGTGEVDDDSES
jgi:Archaea-specific RecJ-like exonuclease, contains DnaJ-type Zn finger domain